MLSATWAERRPEIIDGEGVVSGAWPMTARGSRRVANHRTFGDMGCRLWMWWADRYPVLTPLEVPCCDIAPVRTRGGRWILRYAQSALPGLVGLVLLTSACASRPSDEPHAPTLSAIRPKLDSIDMRIGVQFGLLVARVDTLRALATAAAANDVAEPAPAVAEAVVESDATRSEAVPAGVIRGLVIDGDTGLPIARAITELRGRQIGSLADSAGRFNIPNVPDGRYELMASSLGYQEAVVSIDVRSPQGVAARFVLRPRDWVDCEYVSVRGVRVTVRDVLTGRAPETATALRVTNGRDRWWALANAEAAAAALGLYTQVGGGPLQVEVAAEGYAPWYSSVTAPRPSGGCRVPDTGYQFDVWLLPTEDHSWRREEPR